ncbi:hypothetical protein HOF56_02970 [Candidatus Peribacteria bacterium]|nr:hypothetical protein [Candidatus Peribacteria bacterium]MBT4021526.1 hypothetical protein [Candidatus Peribacteria bacterium]MBT4240623.1 hypothetical protein [Candidatus Peribacteria bacterium]MBT4474629.1 hypothetical protein [Candidatus Peribacteria bacterium]
MGVREVIEDLGGGTSFSLLVSDGVNDQDKKVFVFVFDVCDSPCRSRFKFKVF